MNKKQAGSPDTLIHTDLDWVNLTPGQGNFTFGYYDRCPFDSTGQYHLALEFPQQERLPKPGETAHIGLIEIETGKFEPIAETEAWGHQVGTLAVWLPARPGCFIFNDFDRSENEWIPVIRICSIDSGCIDGIEGHFYNISPDGRYASSINFARIPRRGYSFARAPFRPDILMPDIDREGISIIDIETGRQQMIASYRDMMDIHPRPYSFEGNYFWLNQGNFNSDSSRVMVLFRYTENTETSRPRCTDLYTVNTDGSGLLCSLPNPYWRNAVSHQIWGRTPEEILVDANWCDKGSQYVVFNENIRPLRAEKISDGMGPSGHLNFSPDGKWLAADTYPGKDSIQHLALVNVETGECREIGRFRHKTDAPIDMRCDLHPRWSADSRYITVDTIHNGPRNIFMLDTKEAVNDF